MQRASSGTEDYASRVHLQQSILTSAVAETVVFFGLISDEVSGLNKKLAM